MIRKAVFFITIFFLIAIISKLNAQDQNESCGFSPFMKWYEWKISTNLSEKQRLVVDYLKKADAIRNRAFETIFANAESHYGYPDIRKAIKIVENAYVELEQTLPPKECINYKKRSIEEAQYVLGYHKLRLKYGDGTKEFDKKHHALELAYSSKNSNSDIFSEFYDCLKKVGLMDNIEEELKRLNIPGKYQTK